MNIKSLDTILARGTNRSKYLSKPLPADISSFLSNSNKTNIHTSLITDKDKKKKIAEMIYRADLSLMDKSFKKELSGLVNHNWSKSKIGMPAGVQGIPGPISLFAKQIVKYAPIEKSQAKDDRQLVAESPALLVISAKSESFQNTIEAGRTLEQIWLKLAENNIDASVLGVAVEHNQSRNQIGKLTEDKYFPMILARIGYASKTMPRTRRLKVADILSG